MTRDIGTMRVSFLAFVFLVPLASACGQVQPANNKIAADAAAKKDLAARRVRGATVELFNGRDLTGWTAYQGSDRLPPGSNLVVEKGELRSPASAKGRLTTDQAFENFSLRLEYRFPIGGTIADNFSSGIGIGTALQVEGLTESGMIGFQLRPGSAGNIKVAPFKQSAVLPHRRAAERSIGDWNEIEIRFTGADLTVTLNGEQVNQTRVLNPGPGRIHLLAWGSDVRYRNIRLIPLGPSPTVTLNHPPAASTKPARKTSDRLKAAPAGGSRQTEPGSAFDNSDVYLTLYKNLSERYMLDAVTIDRVPDVSVLAQLARSEDGTVKKLATLRWVMEYIRFRLLTKGDLTKEVGEFRDKLDDYMMDAVKSELRGEKESFQDVAREVSGTLFEESDEEKKEKKESAVHSAQRKLIEATVLAVEGTRKEQLLRTSLRQHLASRHSDVTFENSSFKTAYGQFPKDKDTVYLVLTNNSGRTLHHCVLISQVTVDAARNAQFKAARDREMKKAYDVSIPFGVDKKTMDLTRTLEGKRTEHAGLNRGTIIFVPEWTPGAKLTWALAPLTTVRDLAASADITLSADEGRLDNMALSLPEPRPADREAPNSRQRPANQRR